MRKLLFIPVLVLGAFMVLSCASQRALTTQQDVDNAFQRIYNQYRGDLILDGAGTYTVVSGDTLSAISRESYHNGFYFPIIMLASSEVVLDPDQITPGMELTIPDLQKNLDDARAKGRLKSYLGEIASIYDRRSRPADAAGLRDLAASL